MEAAAMCAYIWWTFETYVHDEKQGIRHFLLIYIMNQLYLLPKSMCFKWFYSFTGATNRSIFNTHTHTHFDFNNNNEIIQMDFTSI